MTSGRELKRVYKQISRCPFRNTMAPTLYNQEKTTNYRISETWGQDVNRKPAECEGTVMYT